MTTRRVRRARRAALAAGLALLLVGLAAGPAAAHAIGTGTAASNYRTTDRGIARAPRASRCAHRRRRAAGAHQPVRPGGARLPPRAYLRVGRGVENQRAPSAYTNRFRTAPASIPSEFDPDAAPEWRRIGDGPSAVWHDHRAHWTGPDPPAVTDSPTAMHVVVPSWQVPLRQGDQDMVVKGDITWVPGPSPWPWVLVAVALFAAALAAAGGYRRPGSLAWSRWSPWPPTWSIPPGPARLHRPARDRAVRDRHLGRRLGGGRTGRLPAAPRAHRRQPGLPAARRGVPDPGQALPDLPALARSQLDSGFGPVVTRAAITVTLGLGAAARPSRAWPGSGRRDGRNPPA